MRRCGCPSWVIALRLGRTETAVQGRLTDLGVRVRRSPGELGKRVRRLAAAGWYDWEIALDLGVKTACVNEVRRRLGIPANGRAKSLARANGWERIRGAKNAG